MYVPSIVFSYPNISGLTVSCMGIIACRHTSNWYIVLFRWRWNVFSVGGIFTVGVHFIWALSQRYSFNDSACGLPYSALINAIVGDVSLSELLWRHPRLDNLWYFSACWTIILNTDLLPWPCMELRISHPVIQYTGNIILNCPAVRISNILWTGMYLHMLVCFHLYLYLFCRYMWSMMNKQYK